MERGSHETFAVWLEQEYIKPESPTLLEAAQAAIDRYGDSMSDDGYRLKEAIEELENAIKREEAKPIRNCDRYGTAEEAHKAFKIMCKNFIGCRECPFRGLTSAIGCAINWLYAEAEK